MPKKDSSKADINYEEMYHLYVDKKLSYKSIGDIYKVNASTIQRLIKKMNITPRNTYELLTKTFDDVFLVRLYCDDFKSCTEISEIIGISHSTISKRLKILGIDLREQREYVSGDKSNTWQGGISSESQLVRSSSEYKNWRRTVFKRDNYTCQCCGNNKGGNLNAHHIENFSSNGELRLEVSNGTTLCINCHKVNIKGSFHNIYGTKNNTRQQLEEYIRQRRIELNNQITKQCLCETKTNMKDG